jgi:elongation factor G
MAEKIQGQEMRGNANVVTAMVPLANMLGYANTLRSISHGHATFAMQFDHYEERPGPGDDSPFRPAIGMRG